eukprot:62662-Chlamydomonas_euryale.AAC.1
MHVRVGGARVLLIPLQNRTRQSARAYCLVRACFCVQAAQLRSEIGTLVTEAAAKKLTIKLPKEDPSEDALLTHAHIQAHVRTSTHPH